MLYSYLGKGFIITTYSFIPILTVTMAFFPLFGESASLRPLPKALQHWANMRLIPGIY